MREDIVTFELAKLAHEKGFDEPTNYSYTRYKYTNIDPEFPKGGGPFGFYEGEIEFEEGYTDHFRSNDAYDMYLAPHKYKLLKWLRDNYRIFVEVFWSGIEFILLITYNDEGSKVETWDRKGPYITYEEAEEIGLLEGLKLIKTEN